MNRFVYLDNNATTKVSDEVKSKVLPFLDLQFGNPSSLYQHGAKIKKEIEAARKNCAQLIGCKEENILFTSSGSEANCAAINSAIWQFPNKKKIITSKVEHSSILEYCKMLEARGFEVVLLDVDENCQINLQQLAKELDKNTAIVSIQFANNEVGAILQTAKLLKIIKEKKKLFDFVYHVDCVQALGKTDLKVNKLSADFASFSGHKIHAPKGIGMLFVKQPSKFVPLVAGHQERNLRGGTENVVGIIAMGEACRLIVEGLKDNVEKLRKIQQFLEEELQKLGGIKINCQKAKRLPNTTSINFEGFEGNKLMFQLEKFGICVSTGSACNSESSKPSYVLTSMGLRNPQNTIRVSIDENTSVSQIEYFIKNLKEVLKGEEK